MVINSKKWDNSKKMYYQIDEYLGTVVCNSVGWLMDDEAVIYLGWPMHNTLVIFSN